MKSDQTPKGRYTLKDHGAGSFTVSITDLLESDSGLYWCAVERSGPDTFKKVKLTVSKGKNDIHSLQHLSTFPSVNALLLLFSPHTDPRESITTSTQPYKDIQTSTDSLTTTPAAHSESPSVTASQTIRDTSPDDTTHSLSTTGNKATSFLLYYLILLMLFSP